MKNPSVNIIKYFLTGMFVCGFLYACVSNQQQKNTVNLAGNSETAVRDKTQTLSTELFSSTPAHTQTPTPPSFFATASTSHCIPRPGPAITVTEQGPGSHEAGYNPTDTPIGAPTAIPSPTWENAVVTPNGLIYCP